MQSLGVTVLGMAVVPMILWLFYSAVRTEWPESYITPSTDYGMVVNRTGFRYFLFRVGPAYFTALVVGTTVSRFRGNGMAAACIGAAIFVVGTQMRHITWVLRGRYGQRRLPIIVVSSTTAIGVLAAAALGGLGPGPFPAVVPPIEEFFKSLWTSAVLALVAVALIKNSRASADTLKLVARSRREVGSTLLKLAHSTAEKYGSDPHLVEAVLLTENLQRPKWVRQLERLKAKFAGGGSYGVMQVSRHGPVADPESVEIAVRDHLQGVTVERHEIGWVDQSLEAALRRYNTNRAFVDLASSIFYELTPFSLDIPEAEDRSWEESDSESGDLSGEMHRQSQGERVALAAETYAVLYHVVATGNGAERLMSLPMDELRSLSSAAASLHRNEPPKAV